VWWPPRKAGVPRWVYSSNPAKGRFESPLSSLNMRVASEMAFACCFFRLGWLNMPALAGRGENPFGAGGVCKTHFQNSPHIWVIGIRRRALSVFPKWISSLPSVTFSGLRRKHSSGLRVPAGLVRHGARSEFGRLAGEGSHASRAREEGFDGSGDSQQPRAHGWVHFAIRREGDAVRDGWSVYDPHDMRAVPEPFGRFTAEVHALDRCPSAMPSNQAAESSMASHTNAHADQASSRRISRS
jgi:hypothetical protein